MAAHALRRRLEVTSKAAPSTSAMAVPAVFASSSGTLWGAEGRSHSDGKRLQVRLWAEAAAGRSNKQTKKRPDLIVDMLRHLICERAIPVCPWASHTAGQRRAAAKIAKIPAR